MKKIFVLVLFCSLLVAQEFPDFLKACKKGDAESCATVGVAFEFGNGVSRDEKKAQMFYRNACLLGSAVACKIMGHKSDGAGKTKDAEFYFSRACKLGMTPLCEKK